MHIRRVISFLLGFWAACVLSVGAITVIGDSVAVSTAAVPPAEASRALALLGEWTSQQLTQYVASEIQRAIYERWGLLELGLTLAIALILFFQNYSRAATIIAGVLVLAAIGSHFLLTPQMVSQGRILDFRPVEMMLNERLRYSNLKLLYAGAAIFRLLCGAGIALLLFRRKDQRPMRRRSTDFEVVDHADHSHVNR